MARRVGRSSNNRNRSWLGYQTCGTVQTGAITAGNSVILPMSVGIGTIGLEGSSFTVQRMRGTHGVEIASPGVNARWLLGIGWIVISEGLSTALTAGTLTTFAPGPLSNPGAMWITYDLAVSPGIGNTLVRGSTSDQSPWEFDSKAQRVCKGGETLLLVAELQNCSGTTTSDVVWEFASAGRILALE